MLLCFISTDAAGVLSIVKVNCKQTHTFVRACVFVGSHTVLVSFLCVMYTHTLSLSPRARALSPFLSLARARARVLALSLSQSGQHTVPQGFKLVK